MGGQGLGMPGTQSPHWIIRGVFGFQTSLNEGALFGIGQGKTWAFVVLSIVAATGILFISQEWASRTTKSGKCEFHPRPGSR